MTFNECKELCLTEYRYECGAIVGELLQELPDEIYLNGYCWLCLDPTGAVTPEQNGHHVTYLRPYDEFDCEDLRGDCAVDVSNSTLATYGASIEISEGGYSVLDCPHQLQEL